MGEKGRDDLAYIHTSARVENKWRMQLDVKLRMHITKQEQKRNEAALFRFIFVSLLYGVHNNYRCAIPSRYNHVQAALACIAMLSETQRRQRKLPKPCMEEIPYVPLLPSLSSDLTVLHIIVDYLYVVTA